MISQNSFATAQNTYDRMKEDIVPIFRGIKIALKTLTIKQLTPNKLAFVCYNKHSK